MLKLFDTLDKAGLVKMKNRNKYRMDDTTTSNSGSGGFENFNFDELIRGALEAASNFFVTLLLPLVCLR